MILDVFFNYFNYNETQLDEVSRTVFAAKDRQAVLQKLQERLSPRYQKSLSLLSLILQGEESKLPEKGLGLWHRLLLLAKHGQVDTSKYLEQYSRVEQSRLDLSDIYKLNPIAYWYFIVIVIVSLISTAIFQVKVLPAFESIYFNAGEELPKLTQWVSSSGNYLLYSRVFFITMLGLAFILPIHLRKNMSQLKAIPYYFKLIPFYWSAINHYHQYVLLIFAECAHHAGDENPLATAKSAMPQAKLDKNNEAFLITASEMTAMDREIIFRKQEIIRQLIKRVKMAEGIMGMIMLILFFMMAVMPVFALYAPIFEFADIIGY